MQHAIQAGFSKDQYNTFHSKLKGWTQIDDKVAWYIFSDMLRDTEWGQENIEFVRIQTTKGMGSALNTIFENHPCWESIIKEIGKGHLTEPKCTVEESKDIIKKKIEEKYGKIEGSMDIKNV